MRILLALAAALFALAAAPPQATIDWRLTTGTAPGSGAFTVGNPAAPVKLVEYLSFTCSHCGTFVQASKAGLHDAMVRKGSVMVETRSAARDPYDLAAWLVARCGGPARFNRLSVAIFAAQDDWMSRGESYAQANLAALRALPQLAQLRTIAERSGLAAIGAKAGVTAPMLDRCFASDAQLKPVLAMTEAAFKKISGTPGFEINGQLAEVHDWPGVEARLRAVGAR